MLNTFVTVLYEDFHSSLRAFETPVCTTWEPLGAFEAFASTSREPLGASETHVFTTRVPIGAPETQIQQCDKQV